MEDMFILAHGVTEVSVSVMDLKASTAHSTVGGVCGALRRQGLASGSSSPGTNL